MSLNVGTQTVALQISNRFLSRMNSFLLVLAQWTVRDFGLSIETRVFKKFLLVRLKFLCCQTDKIWIWKRECQLTTVSLWLSECLSYAINLFAAFQLNWHECLGFSLMRFFCFLSSLIHLFCSLFVNANFDDFFFLLWCFMKSL